MEISYHNQLSCISDILAMFIAPTAAALDNIPTCKNKQLKK
jgi:hypothetical protein